MATNYLEVQNYLKNLDVVATYYPEDDYFSFGFKTEIYLDSLTGC